jgi:hypothetical protein
MMNTDGPSARGNSAYGFSKEERTDITRGMFDGEEPSNQPDPAVDNMRRRRRAVELLEAALHVIQRAYDTDIGEVAISEVDAHIRDALAFLYDHDPAVVWGDDDDQVRRRKPANAGEFVRWAQVEYLRLFRCQVYPVGLKSIDAPKIKGLIVYAAQGFGASLYAAWTEAGKFVGWMQYHPSLSAMDHQFAIGQVLGEQVWPDGRMNAIRRKPVKAWIEALRAAARTLEVG